MPKDKISGKKHGPAEIYVLGNLDSKTRLAMNRHCFLIQVKVKGDTWHTKYYYTRLQEAIRGYSNYALRTSKILKSASELPNVLDALAALDATIKEVGERLDKEWEEIVSKAKNSFPTTKEDISDDDSGDGEDADFEEEDPA